MAISFANVRSFLPWPKPTRRGPLLYTPIIVWHPVFRERGKRRLSNNSWGKQRMRVLVRDNFSCQHKGCRVAYLSQLSVHHIVPKCQGGSDNLSNLTTLCRRCHEALHQGH